MIKKIILLFIVFSVSVSTHAETDSIRVTVLNFKTGKNADLKYDLSFYFDKDSISTNSQISKKDIARIEHGDSVIIKLKIANHNFLSDLSGLDLSNINFLVFKLNFDLPNNSKCNRIYWNDYTGVYYSEQSNEITSFQKKTDCPVIHQSLQISNYEDYLGGSLDNSDLDFYATYFNDFSDLKGKYQASMNDSDFITFELRDSAEFTVILRSEDKILFNENGIWIFDSDFETVTFDLPDSFQSNNNHEIFDSYGLITIREQVSTLTLYSYKLEDGKIIKVKILDLIKE